LLSLWRNSLSFGIYTIDASRVVQYCRVDSIAKRDLTNRLIRRMVNLYWLSDTWSCLSENCISLEGLRKYLTLILWHSLCFALSIRSIRSIRQMVNLYWRSDTWNCPSEKCISLEGLRKYWRSSCGIVPVSLWRFDRFVRFVEWLIFIDDPTSGVVYRKIAFHYSRGIDPVLLCWFVRFVEWWMCLDDPTRGFVDRKSASH